MTAEGRTPAVSRAFHQPDDPQWPLTGMQELLDAGYDLAHLMARVVLPLVEAFYAGGDTPMPERWHDGSAPVVDWTTEKPLARQIARVLREKLPVEAGVLSAQEFEALMFGWPQDELLRPPTDPITWVDHGDYVTMVTSWPFGGSSKLRIGRGALADRRHWLARARQGAHVVAAKSIAAEVAELFPGWTVSFVRRNGRLTVGPGTFTAHLHSGGPASEQDVARYVWQRMNYFDGPNSNTMQQHAFEPRIRLVGTRVADGQLRCRDYNSASYRRRLAEM